MREQQDYTQRKDQKPKLTLDRTQAFIEGRTKELCDEAPANTRRFTSKMPEQRFAWSGLLWQTRQAGP